MYFIVLCKYRHHIPYIYRRAHRRRGSKTNIQLPNLRLQCCGYITFRSRYRVPERKQRTNRRVTQSVSFDSTLDWTICAQESHAQYCVALGPERAFFAASWKDHSCHHQSVLYSRPRCRIWGIVQKAEMWALTGRHIRGIPQMSAIGVRTLSGPVSPPSLRELTNSLTILTAKVVHVVVIWTKHRILSYDLIYLFSKY